MRCCACIMVNHDGFAFINMDYVFNSISVVQLESNLFIEGVPKILLTTTFNNACCSKGCSVNTTDDVDIGMLTWLVTTAGKTAESVERCPLTTMNGLPCAFSNHYTCLLVILYVYLYS